MGLRREIKNELTTCFCYWPRKKHLVCGAPAAATIVFDDSTMIIRGLCWEHVKEIEDELEFDQKTQRLRWDNVATIRWITVQ